jgi:hypothetical protein
MSKLVSKVIVCSLALILFELIVNTNANPIPDPNALADPMASPLANPDPNALASPIP